MGRVSNERVTEMTVLDKLEYAARGMGDFTSAESSVASFILDHADDVIRGSIADLAERSYSSNATIIRLCRKVGVSGFREFKVVFASDLERRRTEYIPVDLNLPFTPSDDVEDIAASIAALSKMAIDATYAALSMDDVEKTAHWIHDARSVMLFATGDTGISAEAFASLLLKIGIRATIAGDYGEYLAAAYTAGPDDVALIVTYSGGLLDIEQIPHSVAVLHERGCKVVYISSQALSGLRPDIFLQLPARERPSGKMATFYSQACVRYLFNCLYSVIFSFDYERNIAAKYLIDAKERPKRD